ncbi:MAG: glycosyltransferase [Bacteroidales bacterium]|jgi:glycosyltransferase involved in cell wall biosynthesis
MPDKQLKFIYWFAYYNLDSPSVRYRAKYPLDFAKEKLGISYCLVIPGYSPVRLLKFIKAYFSVLLFRRHDSIIVIQRIQSNFIYAALLKLLIKIRRSDSVYDLDDADYLDRNPKTIFYFARNCEYISAGSQKIAKYMMQFNQKVHHITSPTPDLNLVKNKKNDVFTIGWIGGFGGGHKDSLFKIVFPAIKGLTFQCKFILIGVTKREDIEEIKNYFGPSGNIDLEIPSDLDWNNEHDLQKRIVKFDVGIATLLNNPLQLSKSGIKAKQYLNNGVPVLSTNLPENNEVVKEGVNGYFCDSTDEFNERLMQFHEMTDSEYAHFSINARKSVINFNHSKYIENFEMIKYGMPLIQS